MTKFITKAVLLGLITFSSIANAAGANWFIGLWEGLIIAQPNVVNGSGVQVAMSITRQDNGAFTIRQFLPNGFDDDDTCVGKVNFEAWRGVGTAELQDGDLISQDLTWSCGSAGGGTLPTSFFIADTKNGTITHIREDFGDWMLFHRVNSPRLTVGR